MVNPVLTMHQVKIGTPEYRRKIGIKILLFCILLICLIYIWFYHFELGRCKVIVHMYNDVETRGSSTAAGRHYGGFITRCILSIPYNMHVVVTINVYLYMYSRRTLLPYTPINHWQAIKLKNIEPKKQKVLYFEKTNVIQNMNIMSKCI